MNKAEQLIEALISEGSLTKDLEKLIKATKDKADARAYSKVMKAVEKDDKKACDNAIRNLDTALRDELPKSVLKWAGW